MSSAQKNTGIDDITPVAATESYNNLRPKPDDYVVDIPLTHIRSHQSRRDEEFPEMLRQETGLDSIGQRNFGRRRIRGPGDNGEPRSLNKLGKFYEKLINFSIVTRYLIYVLPISLILAIPALIGGFGPRKDSTIEGVRMVWFFIWIQIIWVSLWASKLVAKALPYIFVALVGVVSSGVKKYVKVIRALELPISLVGWTITSLTTFTPLMTRNPDKRRIGDTSIKPWMARMNAILGACVVSSLVYLGQKVFIQLVSVNYHRKQFEGRIQENKKSTKLLAHLYEVSRKFFPDYTEFAEEDCIIHQGMAGALLTPGAGKSGSGTPMRMRQMIGNLNVVGNRVTSAFGNVAREVTGRNVFNPNAAYSVVLDALHRKDSSEALARRIWMSFVAEDSESLTKEDLVEVMGADREEIALECFSLLDRDENGDVSLEEMISGVLFMHTERKDVSKGMQDVDNAIGVLDNVLGTIVLIVVVFIFIAFNFNNFNTVLAAAGTVLLSLSFIFAITAQEVLGSCIFLFVKHPYDVGDRIDINDNKFVVLQICLLYTVFKRVDNGKTSQVPNNVLNSLWIENVSRSKQMQETVKLAVDFGTSFDDIQALKEEMAKFIKENNRDFRPDFDIDISGVNNLDRLLLSIPIQHKSNWANGDLACQRRNKFICALVTALRKVPIYGPGGGNPAVGEEGKPMYTVAIGNDLAQENMKKAAKAKKMQRWDYASSDSDSDDSPPSKGNVWQGSQETGANSSSAPFDPTAATTGYQQNLGLSRTDSRRTRRSLQSVRSAESRRHDLEVVRGTLQRGTTRGRRKVGATMGSSIVIDPPRVPPISPNPSNINVSNDCHPQGFPPSQVHFTPPQALAAAQQALYIQQQQSASEYPP